VESEAHGTGDRLAADPVRSRPGQGIDLHFRRRIPQQLAAHGHESPWTDLGLMDREMDSQHPGSGNAAHRLVMAADRLTEGIVGVDHQGQMAPIKGPAAQGPQVAEGSGRIQAITPQQ
jgi:hypothetical protein